MIDDKCGAIGGMRVGRGNRSTRTKPAPVPLCTPQIPYDLTWARTLSPNTSCNCIKQRKIEKKKRFPYVYHSLEILSILKIKALQLKWNYIFFFVFYVTLHYWTIEPISWNICEGKCTGTWCRETQLDFDQSLAPEASNYILPMVWDRGKLFQRIIGQYFKTKNPRIRELEILWM
jgi:hypothetical protein